MHSTQGRWRKASLIVVAFLRFVRAIGDLRTDPRLSWHNYACIQRVRGETRLCMVWMKRTWGERTTTYLASGAGPVSQSLQRVTWLWRKNLKRKLAIVRHHEVDVGKGGEMGAIERG